MAKGGRLLGIDVGRGLAAYGVVVIHAFGNHPRSWWAVKLGGLFLAFAVPFFLASSLYLTVGRLRTRGTSGFLRGRVERLIVPYLMWTAIFVVVRGTLYVASGRRGDLYGLVASPLPLLLLGEASAQLYFIPLLLAGEVIAVALVALWGDRLGRPGLVVPLAAAGVALSWFDTLRRSEAVTRRGGPVGPYVVWNEARFVVWVLPFLALALLFQLEPVRRRIGALRPWAIALILAALAAIDLLTVFPELETVFPSNTRDLIVAFGALAAVIAVSPWVVAGRRLASLTACTFGIYLIHPLVTEFLEQVLTRTGVLRGVVISPAALAAFAAVAFFASWALVALTIRVPLLARLLYGVRPGPG